MATIISPTRASGYAAISFPTTTLQTLSSTSSSKSVALPINSSTTAKRSTSSQSPKVVQSLIIIGIILATIIIIFWIWMCCRISNGCTHDDSSCRCRKMRKWLDWVAFGSTQRQSTCSSEKNWSGEEGRTRRYILGNDISRRILGDPRPQRSSQASTQHNRHEPRGHGRGDSEGAILTEIGATRTVDTRMGSRKTILCELEGDLGKQVRKSLDRPLPPFLPEIRFGNVRDSHVTSASVFKESKILVVAEGKTATIVKAKEAATIVAVGRSKPLPKSPGGGSIQDPFRDLAGLSPGSGFGFLGGIDLADMDGEDVSVREKEEGQKEREIRDKRKVGKRRKEAMGRDRAGSQGIELLREEVSRPSFSLVDSHQRI